MFEGLEAFTEAFREFGVRRKIMKQWSGAKCLRVSNVARSANGNE